MGAFVLLEPRPITVPKRVPADRAQPRPLCGWFDLSVQNTLLPHRLAGTEVGKDEVFRPFVGIGALLLPTQDFRGEVRVERQRRLAMPRIRSLMFRRHSAT